MDGLENLDNDSIQQLIEDLRSDDEKIRRYAAEDLGFGMHAEGVPHLAKGLEDESIAVSEACADALIKIGGQEVAERIAPALASENVRLRNHASEIMNQLGESAVPVLIKQLESPNHDVRIFAVENLVCISSPKSIGAFIKALDDDNVNVAAAAAIGLGKVGEPDHLEVLKKYLDFESWMRCSVLRGMGFLGNKKAIGSILPLIHDNDLMVKISAIQALATLADYNILPELLNLLKEESLELFGIDTLSVTHEIIKAYPDIDYSYLFDDELLNAMIQLTKLGGTESQIKAVEILGYSKAEKIVPDLIKLISSDGIDVRKTIVNSIVQIDPQDLTSLKRFLEDPEALFEQKCTALECIGRSSSKHRYEIIKYFLSSKNETLPRITLDAIHADFKPVPVKEISRLLESEIPEIRVSAAAAMGRLKQETFISVLIKQLNDKNPEVQEAVDDSLIQIGENHEIPLLAPYLDSFSKSERKTAFEYFGIHHPETISHKFLEGLQDPSVEIRMISFKAIANLKLANLDLIKTGVQDPVDMVQVQAVRTLKSLPLSHEIISFIKHTLQTASSERVKVELIQVLSGLEDINVVDSIIPLLHDDSSWVKIEAVEYLKSHGDSSIIKHLEPFLESEDIDFAEIVEEAISQLE
ncbi:HEAT repeat domain-containing protein [bacterium]|nr:HEAT repeat domain-containing protein [bacterium]